MGPDSVASKTTRLILDRPKLTLAVSLSLIALALLGITRTRSDFSYRVWFWPDDPELVAFDAFERRFGNDEPTVVAVQSPSGIFDPSTAKLLTELTKELWRAPEVIRVDGISNFNWVHAAGDDIIIERFIPDDEELTPALLQERRRVALAHETLPGYLISPDAKTTLIFLQLKPSFDGSPDFAAHINGIRKILGRYRGKGDHSFYITGGAAISQAFEESTQHDMRSIVPIVVLIILTLLSYMFRSLWGIVLPVLVMAATIALTISLAGWADIPFSSITSIVPQFLMAIATADTVHILVTFFRARAAGADSKGAAQLSLSKNFLPTILTSVSTTIGFLSFSTSKILPISQLGVLAAFGTVMAWAITYFVAGPLLVLVSPKSKAWSNAVDHSTTSPFAEKAARRIHRWRGALIGVFALACAASAILAFDNTVNSDPFKYFAKDYWLSLANAKVEKEVGGVMGPEIILESGRPEGIKDPVFLNKAAAFQDWINSDPIVSKSVSIVDVLKHVNRSLHGGAPQHYSLPANEAMIAQELLLYTMSLPRGMDINDRVTIKNDAIRLTALWTLHDSAGSLTKSEEFKKKARSMGLNATFTGKTLLWSGMNPKVVESGLVSISMACVVISMLLVVAFGSLRLGVLAMIPNVIPLLVGGALLRLMGQPLDVGTVLVGGTCLGIAVDDTIHFLSDFNRLTREGSSRQEAIARVFTHTAPALIVTTIILAAAFGTFAWATFVPNMNFGIMVAAMLSVALVTDLIFLPALLMTLPLGRRDQASGALRRLE